MPADAVWQGYTEVRYDEERKRVVYEPLQLTQAFRYVCVHLRLHCLSLSLIHCSVLRDAHVSPLVTPNLSTIIRNFDALSPWEQIGEGTAPKRPDELKRVPPPPPPPAEQKK